MAVEFRRDKEGRIVADNSRFDVELWEKTTCRTCQNGWYSDYTKSIHPRGEWPCITCSRNVIYGGHAAEWCVDHYKELNKIEP